MRCKVATGIRLFHQPLLTTRVGIIHTHHNINSTARHQLIPGRIDQTTLIHQRRRNIQLIINARQAIPRFLPRLRPEDLGHQPGLLLRLLPVIVLRVPDNGLLRLRPVTSTQRSRVQGAHVHHRKYLKRCCERRLVFTSQRHRGRLPWSHGWSVVNLPLNTASSLVSSFKRGYMLVLQKRSRRTLLQERR